MFNNPFSFDGRIRRTEYGLSMILYFVAYAILFAVVASDRDFSILFIAMIPMLWFLWAQGAKRCHDLGNSGWWQLIPLYPLWLLFQEGQIVANQYGENPKGINLNSNNPNNNSNNQTGYSGGYSGGHNSTNSGSATHTPPKNEGYDNGDLYK